MNNVITLQLTKQEANAVLRALAHARFNERTPEEDLYPNGWVANRLVALLREEG